MMAFRSSMRVPFSANCRKGRLSEALLSADSCEPVDASAAPRCDTLQQQHQISKLAAHLHAGAVVAHHGDVVQGQHHEVQRQLHCTKYCRPSTYMVLWVWRAHPRRAFMQ